MLGHAGEGHKEEWRRTNGHKALRRWDVKDLAERGDDPASGADLLALADAMNEQVVTRQELDVYSKSLQHELDKLPTLQDVLATGKALGEILRKELGQHMADANRRIDEVNGSAFSKLAPATKSLVDSHVKDALQGAEARITGSVYASFERELTKRLEQLEKAHSRRVDALESQHTRQLDALHSTYAKMRGDHLGEVKSLLKSMPPPVVHVRNELPNQLPAEVVVNVPEPRKRRSVKSFTYDQSGRPYEVHEREVDDDQEQQE